MTAVDLAERPSWRLTAGVTGAVVLVAGGAALLSRGDGPGAPPAPAAQPPVAVSAPAAPGPVVPAPDVTYVDLLGATSLPVSRTAGPRDLEAGRARGFARSDLGAGLAAVHLMSRANAGVGPEVYEPTIAEQVYGDRDTLLSVTDRQYRQRVRAAGVAPGEPLIGGVNRRAGVPGGRHARGYRVAPGSDERTRSVRLLMVAPDPATGRDVPLDFRVAVTWRDGDWRLQAPMAGDWGAAATTVDPVAQDAYTLFGG